MKTKHCGKTVFLITLFTIAGLISFGCKELSNEAEGTKTFTLDMAHVKSQLDAGSNSPGVRKAISASKIKSLVLGAIVVPSRSTPYTSGMEITKKIEDNLKKEAINSVQYLSIVEYPFSKEYLKFLVPPPTAGKWQVGVISLDFVAETLSEFEDYESKGGLLHKGFAERFYTYDDIGDQIIRIEMKNYNKEKKAL